MFGMSIQSLLSEIVFPRTIVLNGVHRLAAKVAFPVHFHIHHADVTGRNARTEAHHVYLNATHARE